MPTVHPAARQDGPADISGGAPADGLPPGDDKNGDGASAGRAGASTIDGAAKGARRRAHRAEGAAVRPAGAAKGPAIAAVAADCSDSDSEAPGAGADPSALAGQEKGGSAARAAGKGRAQQGVAAVSAATTGKRKELGDDEAAVDDDCTDGAGRGKRGPNRREHCGKAGAATATAAAAAADTPLDEVDLLRAIPKSGERAQPAPSPTGQRPGADGGGGAGGREVASDHRQRGTGGGRMEDERQAKEADTGRELDGGGGRRCCGRGCCQNCWDGGGFGGVCGYGRRAGGGRGEVDSASQPESAAALAGGSDRSGVAAAAAAAAVAAVEAVEQQRERQRGRLPGSSLSPRRRWPEQLAARAARAARAAKAAKALSDAEGRASAAEAARAAAQERAAAAEAARRAVEVQLAATRAELGEARAALGAGGGSGRGIFHCDGRVYVQCLCTEVLAPTSPSPPRSHPSLPSSTRLLVPPHLMCGVRVGNRVVRLCAARVRLLVPLPGGRELSPLHLAYVAYRTARPATPAKARRRMAVPLPRGTRGPAWSTRASSLSILKAVTPTPPPFRVPIAIRTAWGVHAPAQGGA
jgi:hypothetical protein